MNDRVHMWLKPISSCFVLRKHGEQLASFFHVFLKGMTESQGYPHGQLCVKSEATRLLSLNAVTGPGSHWVLSSKEYAIQLPFSSVYPPFKR